MYALFGSWIMLLICFGTAHWVTKHTNSKATLFQNQVITFLMMILILVFHITLKIGGPK